MSERRTSRPRLRAGLVAAGAIALSACQSVPRRAPPPPGAVTSIPNAVPRIEPRSIYGNPPFYDVFGKRYFVRRHCRGYEKRGVASWYGPGFYEDETSDHEPYDGYAMTAAHRTLPLPCNVRVTNLQNGRSVVVRVNDRGPFVKNRIIDLSYSAAAKLGMLRTGTAMVEVQSIDPRAPAAPPTVAATAPTVAATAPSVPSALYIQTGAFADPANARRLLATLRAHGYEDAFERDDVVGGRRLYRVQIGPVQSVDDYDRIIDSLERIGVDGARLAPN
ncbi:MAG TPA: septal ring lytic transglycosylase RlpA family protein [Steroidobacteraceae bacterium]|nr:septal ring lytic transglycosylase RlpA family protein [Steroidobacteraceae bacterium]